MAVTILMYSLFSGLTFFATNLWQVGALRFVVAMGVGGEWAVAASLVAEVFPRHARAHASGIFHATSVLGTWIAAIAGMAVGAQWRFAYLLGILPALLILVGQAKVSKSRKAGKKPSAKAAVAAGPKMGSFRDLLLNPRWGKRAILGMLLAAVGLGSFWGVTVAGTGSRKPAARAKWDDRHRGFATRQVRLRHCRNRWWRPGVAGVRSAGRLARATKTRLA